MLNKIFKVAVVLAGIFTSAFLFSGESAEQTGLPLLFWGEDKFENFGDVLSLKLVERIVGGSLEYYKKPPKKNLKKLLAIGSILSWASEGDVVWGSGINGKLLDAKSYKFQKLDVRAVRGPLTRQFLKENFQINCPAVYGDPALLIPYFFPEFQKKSHPSYPYIIIPHYYEIPQFPKSEYPNVVYPSEPWDTVIEKILNSRFVISGSLHGIVVAEAFGIPARLLKTCAREPIFKYRDYYLGTNRPNFQIAYTVEEALQMGGEPPYECDLKKLYEAFPFEFWQTGKGK